MSSLQVLLLPSKVISVSQDLAHNVRVLCSDTLFIRASNDIKALPEREDWQIHAEEGGIITSLPVLFENLVVEILLSLKEVIVESLPGEPKRSDTLLSQSLERFHDLLEDFTFCIDNLAFKDRIDESTEEQSGVNVRVRANSVSSDDAEASTLPPDQRLLMILSNLIYSKTVVAPRLFAFFTSHGYPYSKDMQASVLAEMDDLEKKMYDEYMQHKSQKLTNFIQNGASIGGFNWETCPRPSCVRTYVREVIFNLVVVHAEVYSVSAGLVKKVLEQLVGVVAAQMLTLVKSVKKFSLNGVFHIYVEVMVLQTKLSPFLTDQSKKDFQQSLKTLGSIPYDEKLEDMIAEFEKCTELQTRCFGAVRPKT